MNKRMTNDNISDLIRPSVESLELYRDNHSDGKTTTLRSKWKPAKSLSNFQTRPVTRFISEIHTDRQMENDRKPVHKRVVDLSNELDKNLAQKHHQHEINILGLNETMVCPWRDNEKLSECNILCSQRRKWTMNSKLQPLSYQPNATFHERFLNNKLSVLGSKSNIKERNDDRSPISKKARNSGKEARDFENGLSSSNHSQWSEAFTQERVRRLNEVFLSLSDKDSMKLRSRRLKCSCLFHQ
jgi:hypothetical protein